ncbi:hypothetical protein EUGRSUZ_J01430 [Eucalyptus grandis]|uniref:RING-type E3 ubiquitin transferase n=2 Tax=Eucalyptus grandis TaxID=71139 RepID=A0A059AED9_EUCGR|nr:hypothetical protein EUGRSUZ_J01430 [Eucalyptus grandis]
MSSSESEIQGFDVLSDLDLDLDLDLDDHLGVVDAPRHSDQDHALDVTSDLSDDEGRPGFDRPEGPSAPSPSSRGADSTGGGVEAIGIDLGSDWGSGSEPSDSVSSDSLLDVREEFDWEETVGGAIGGIEQATASSEQGLRDPDREFSFSFYSEGSGVNPNWDSDPVFVIRGDRVDPDERFAAAAAAAAARRIRRNEIIRRGDSPAASTRVVEGLPLITVSEEGLGDGDGVCAVCKDKFVQGEKLRVLPCVHRYHQDCILPWLSMRNTCPVCRFELPRDDSRPGIQRTVRDGAMSGGGLHSDTPI